MTYRCFFLFLSLALCAMSQSLADVREESTTLANQRSVNVTVYNDGNALVHDRRVVRLHRGLNRIAWRDVSASMDATSALLDAPDSSGVTVLEQDFNYDVLNQDAMLRAYVGHEVTVVHPPRFAGERERRERARILSLDGGVTLQYADRVETTLDGYIIYPRVPSSLRDEPTLTLDLMSHAQGAQPLDLRYMTSGLTWNVNYVATLAPDQAHMTLEGLVTLSNTSGTSYRNARLQLVAGNVNVASTPSPVLKTIARVSSSNAYSAGARQEDYFEYHLYTIGYPTTILDKQTKQLMLLSAHDVTVEKTYELRGSPYYYRNQEGYFGHLAVGVYVSFTNSGGDLGIPLPAGIVRVYQDDSNGLAQFLGSDGIRHTPRNDTVKLHLGDAFDLVATRKQTDFHLLSNCHTQSSYAIRLLNAKSSAQTVRVIEPIGGDWRIASESLPHEKSSAETATWSVSVPGQGETTLTYTADVRWCKD